MKLTFHMFGSAPPPDKTGHILDYSVINLDHGQKNRVVFRPENAKMDGFFRVGSIRMSPQMALLMAHTRVSAISDVVLILGYSSPSPPGWLLQI